MGYVRHNAIIVIDHGYGDGIEEAHAMATKIFTAATDMNADFGALVSPVIHSALNGYRSFYVAPDGSKEGWESSDTGDLARRQLRNWLHEHHERLGYVDFVEVEGFGGDDNHAEIANHSRAEGRDE